MCDASTLGGQGHQCNVIGPIPDHQFQGEGPIPDLHAGDSLQDLGEG